MTGEERGALETRTGDAMPDRHPSTSPSGHAYGPPATDQQWAIFHRDMAPREAWQPEYSERVGLEHYRDLAGQAPSAAESRLTIERHGHTIEVDARGVSIDGQRVPGVSPPTATEARLPGDPYNSQALQITDRGAVVVHGRIVASVAVGQEPRLYGDRAPAWARGAGHTVVADQGGLSIDGQRVSDQILPPPVGHAPLRITDKGTVTWCVEKQEDGRTVRRHEPVADLIPNPKRPDLDPVVRGRAAAADHRTPEPAERHHPPAEIDFDEEIDL
ncbi:hypothetical protein OHB49_45440 (plasmid) [Streptomyces sp. NBC_01717]|uniref:hypothetical protein n=1 Tax=Streptomyces sp. NBC_01717 TaxID=2975918 RepID=UPI002E33CBB2|nr:hypothetical protein [Streptomyces sp. NBC_01717]